MHPFLSFGRAWEEPREPTGRALSGSSPQDRWGIWLNWPQKKTGLFFKVMPRFFANFEKKLREFEVRPRMAHEGVTAPPGEGGGRLDLLLPQVWHHLDSGVKTQPPLASGYF